MEKAKWAASYERATIIMRTKGKREAMTNIRLKRKFTALRKHRTGLL